MPFAELRYFSNALRKQTAVNLILPTADQPGPWTVMFLLHGLSDDHSIWERRTSIERYVEGMNLLVVMPDGGRGFYCDALEGYAYATALGVELPALLRNTFRTAEAWCITGLSMGGYGAFKLAFDQPDLFRSAVSHSGALRFGHTKMDGDDDFSREFRHIIGADPVGGSTDLFARVLDTHPLPALRFDCGVDDFLLDANRDYHAHLREHGVVHEYEEFAGDHNWAYWDLHVQEALQFHRRNLFF